MPWHQVYQEQIIIAGLIGTLVSILSAAVSWKKAILSKESAEESVKLLSKIRNHRTISTLSEVITETDILIRNLTAIGPHSDLSRLKGFNTQKIAEELEGYRQKILSKERLLPGPIQDKINEIAPEIYSISTKLSETNNPSEIKQSGSDIYQTLSIFKPLLEKHNDHVDNI